MTTMTTRLRSWLGPVRARGRRRAPGAFGDPVDRLEGRRLLTGLAPALMAGPAGPAGATAIPVDLAPVPAPAPLASPLGPPTLARPRLDQGINPVAPAPAPGPGSPSGRRADISAAMIVVDGQPTREVAVADDSTGRVIVFDGTTAVLTVSGLDDPEAVKLADLTNDGTPDLIIADSGRDRVLVYAGLAGGGFGPELGGGSGFAVGQDPVGLSVGALDGAGQADLAVADQGSDQVSILDSHGSGADWSLTLRQTLAVGSSPNRAAIVQPPDGPAGPDLVVCDRGSGDVSFYQATDDGSVATDPFQVLSVGANPSDMLLGRFGHHDGLGLVALNSQSDQVTYFQDVFAAHPVRQEIAARIGNLTSVVALGAGAADISGLMVTNASGQIAYLQATDSGLVLAGLGSPAGLSQVTAIALGDASGNGFAVYEAASGSASLDVVQFDLGTAASFLTFPVATDLAGPPAGGDAPTFVELAPAGAGGLDLQGFIWTGAMATGTTAPAVVGAAPTRGRSTQGPPPSWTIDDESADRVRASSRLDDEAGEGPAEPSAAWTRFVFGIDAALDSFQGEVAALAEADSWPGGVDRSTGPELVERNAHRSGATVRLARPDATSPRSARRDRPYRVACSARPKAAPAPARAGWGPGRGDAQAESSGLTTAALGSAVAVRLLVNASPPRPPRRAPRARSPWGLAGRWPEALPPTSPHA